MSNRPAQDGHQPFLVVLSSPSGAGKTSICRGVTKQDRRVAYSVSATTRPRRKGEVNGRSYSFLTEKRFKRLVARNGLLEHALVYGYYYGTPKAPVLRHFRAGQDVIADLDVQGMRSAKAALPGTVAVFVTAPCRTEIGRRLKRRGTDSEQTMARRQAEMEAEFAAIPDFDYLVVNDRLNDAVARVLAIIRAERQRTARHPAFARRGMSR
ncbi:MAG: guanylate kinase [candidate division WOR-3 bacterium]|nr:MAG: guanylate kinase [candidate division WOR-3 bacterium]